MTNAKAYIPISLILVLFFGVNWGYTQSKTIAKITLPDCTSSHNGGHLHSRQPNDLVLSKNEFGSIKFETQPQTARSKTQRQSYFTIFFASFGVLLLVGLLLLVVVVYQRVWHLEQQNELEIAEAEQLLAQTIADNKLANLKAWIEGQEKERERLALDMHDSLGGLLAHIKILSESGNETAKIPELLGLAIGELRANLQDLQPWILNHLSLFEALDQLVQQRQTGAAANLKFESIGDDNRVGHIPKRMIYRIVQECLTNAVRHGKASEVLVLVICRADGIKLFVEDDGVGFDSLQQTGTGLHGVRLRVEALNGQLEVSSEKNWGTSIAIDIPVTTN